MVTKNKLFTFPARLNPPGSRFVYGWWYWTFEIETMVLK